MEILESINWQILVGIYVVTFSTYSLVQKRLMSRPGIDPVAVSGVFQTMVAVFHLLIIVVVGYKAFDLQDIIVVTLVSSTAFLFATICIFSGFQTAPASEGSVILASSSLWVAVLAAIVKGDRLSIEQIFGLMLIVMGVVLISWQKSANNKFKLTKGHAYIALGAFLFACGFTFGTELVDKTDVFVTGFISFFLPGIGTFLVRPGAIKNVGVLFKEQNLKYILTISVIYTIGVTALTYAYFNGGLASQVSPLSQANILVTVVLSYFLLKERDHLGKKFLAALLVIAGVVLLA